MANLFQEMQALRADANEISRSRTALLNGIRNFRNNLKKNVNVQQRDFAKKWIANTQLARKQRQDYVSDIRESVNTLKFYSYRNQQFRTNNRTQIYINGRMIRLLEVNTMRQNILKQRQHNIHERVQLHQAWFEADSN